MPYCLCVKLPQCMKSGTHMCMYRKKIIVERRRALLEVQYKEAVVVKDACRDSTHFFFYNGAVLLGNSTDFLLASVFF